MKTKYILKTVGLATALSFSSIFLVSCHDDKSESTGTELQFDFSALPVARTITNHFSLKSFVISSGSKFDLNYEYVTENSLDGSIGGSKVYNIVEFISEQNNLQKITLSALAYPEFEESIENDIIFYSEGGVFSNEFAAIISKYTNDVTPSQSEGDQLAETLNIGVDEELNLFIVDTVTIDFINNTYTQTGREVIINSTTDVTITDEIYTRILTITN